jgi:hypothetical protein
LLPHLLFIKFQPTVSICAEPATVLYQLGFGLFLENFVSTFLEFRLEPHRPGQKFNDVISLTFKPPPGLAQMLLLAVRVKLNC